MKLNSQPPTMWLTAMGVSFTTLVWGSVAEFALPTPETTGNWSFYGVLLCAIIILGLSLGFVLRWVAVTWLKSQSETNMVLSELRASMDANTEAVSRSNQWFEKLVQNFVQHGLDVAHFSFLRKAKGEDVE